ncbi:hypothetical protein SAMN04488243_12012 [Thermus arciformis]|uniref:Uncharacterized protein n=1 Tax=Thermus arciformis TaxID=482827 RepID=A0A1G7HK79_9DEIN|nr:hypothetical protein [Thermus arciformis]SDF00798.1 hypothetical protein SAMN04488243_12012 [Thermus arciformis]
MGVYRRLPDGGWRYEVVEAGLDLEELYVGLSARTLISPQTPAVGLCEAPFWGSRSGAGT